MDMHLSWNTASWEGDQKAIVDENESLLRMGCGAVRGRGLDEGCWVDQAHHADLSWVIWIAGAAAAAAACPAPEAVLCEPGAHGACLQSRREIAESCGSACPYSGARPGLRWPFGESRMP